MAQEEVQILAAARRFRSKGAATASAPVPAAIAGRAAVAAGASPAATTGRVGELAGRPVGAGASRKILRAHAARRLRLLRSSAAAVVRKLAVLAPAVRRGAEKLRSAQGQGRWSQRGGWARGGTPPPHAPCTAAPYARERAAARSPLTSSDASCGSGCVRLARTRADAASPRCCAHGSDAPVHALPRRSARGGDAARAPLAQLKRPNRARSGASKG